jgi:hypothetical protein
MIPKERKKSIQLQIINKFITTEFSKDKYFYPRESKMANKLIEKYTKEFLLWVSPPFGYKVTSLSYFITSNGKDYLNGQYFEYLKTKINLTKKTDEQIGKEVLGQNIEISVKPKTLQEFLNI